MTTTTTTIHNNDTNLCWTLFYITLFCFHKLVNGGRAYPDGCAHYPPSYIDYESADAASSFPLRVPIRTTNDFLFTRRLGSGKFSDVFEAVDRKIESIKTAQEKNLSTMMMIDPSSLVVVKCLKPVSDRKVRREVLVLTRASSLPNCVHLKGIVIPANDNNKITKENTNNNPETTTVSSQPSMPSIILEHAGPQSRWLCHGGGGGSALYGASTPKTTTTTNASEDGIPSMMLHRENRYLTDFEIRYYLYHLLLGLDALHSRGIMHRDVKPRNVLINRSATWNGKRTPSSSSISLMPSANTQSQSGMIYSTKHSNTPLSSLDQMQTTTTGTSTPTTSSSSSVQNVRPLMLIDLGLADFYLPGRKYNVRVASRHYKSPELLIGNESYDYAIDLWGVGCILAGLLFRREPFFRGKDNADQLGKITSVLGSEELFTYCQKCNIQCTPDILSSIARYTDHNTSNNNNNNTNKYLGMQKNNISPTQQQSALMMMERRRRQRSWLSFLHDSCPMPSPDAMDLLEGLLKYDPDQRFSAREAMAHRFFDSVRSIVETEAVRGRIMEERK